MVGCGLQHAWDCLGCPSTFSASLALSGVDNMQEPRSDILTSQSLIVASRTACIDVHDSTRRNLGLADGGTLSMRSNWESKPMHSRSAACSFFTCAHFRSCKLFLVRLCIDLRSNLDRKFNAPSSVNRDHALIFAVQLRSDRCSYCCHNGSQGSLSSTAHVPGCLRPELAFQTCHTA